MNYILVAERSFKELKLTVMTKYGRKLLNWFRQRRPQRDSQIRHHSKYDNVYHCTVQKTASQWILGILSDPALYPYSGLAIHQPEKGMVDQYDPRRLVERSHTKPFPLRTIASPFYIDYPNFAGLPKPEIYRAFFVMRDPRDVVVSWYFSSKYSHQLMGRKQEVREVLDHKSLVDGLLYSIDHLNSYGLFTAQYSWLQAAGTDPNVMLVRFEDLIAGEPLKEFTDLFEFCDIRVPVTVLSRLLFEHSFQKLSGRQRGAEDQKAHYRKGVHGDWKNYFNDRIHSHFVDTTGDLAERWGYEIR